MFNLVFNLSKFQHILRQFIHTCTFKTNIFLPQTINSLTCVTNTINAV